jgi:hypothetical protein
VNLQQQLDATTRLLAEFQIKYAAEKNRALELEAKLAAAEADAKVAASHSICGCGLCTRLAAAEQTADCGGK